ncbi:MAG TPA: NUDIX domain-containing protein [Motilibacteraceae bacterium]|nr:NUDIX domain-containing protein [Motilibacteraceae bacterium]
MERLMEKDLEKVVEEVVENGLEKVAWVHVRDGALLVARNRGRRLFYLPGGRREPEESHAQTLVREVMEELGVRLDPSTMRSVAEVTAPRDGAPGLVRMSCYTAAHLGALGDLVPAGEVVELGWFTVADYARVTVAEQQVIDLLVARGQMAG